MRRLCLVLMIGLPLAGCAGGWGSSAKPAVDAVVQDESQRQKAAAAAQAGASSAEALATVSDGPKDQAPSP
jgi:uncharacterized protein YceK